MSESLVYWQNRYKKYGSFYVGDKRHNVTEHYLFYEDKKNYIKKFIPEYSKVLDFGCGVGMFADLFDNTKYIGVDIVLNEFFYNQYDVRLIKPFEKIDIEVDLIFTGNVLQHIEDVDSVFKSWTIRKGHLLLFENCKDQNYYTFGRTLQEYRVLIENNFEINEISHDYFNGNNILIKVKL